MKVNFQFVPSKLNVKKILHKSIYFMHIPKSGGTTIDHIFLKLFSILKNYHFKRFKYNEENKKNNKDQLREFKKLKAKYIARDKSDKLVYLADSKFSLELAKQNFSDLKFHEKSEF